MRAVNYTFNAAAKTVTFTDLGSIALESIIIVANVTRGITIFQFNKASLTGTVAGNVLTVAYDTTAMSNSDKLGIYYSNNDLNTLQTILSDVHDVGTHTVKTSSF